MTISPTQLVAENSLANIRASLRSGFNAPIKQQLSINWTTHLEVPSDITVEVSGITFALHKFPLTSRCGLLKMLVVEEREGETSRVELEGVPGGSEGFELAAKFCYGACLEISKHNVVLLRCVAEFLDMSEEHGGDNLISQTESYLERLGKQSFKDMVATLHSCENHLPMAEDLKIVSRCIDWAASKAILEQDVEYSNNHGHIPFHDFHHSPNNNFDWWVDDLSILRIGFYQRVLTAMREKGLKSEGVCGALVVYAHKSLKGLTKKSHSLWDTMGNKRKSFDATATMEHEQRILVETIVSLLPTERHVASINFLIGLLRTACILETTLACQLDLEKRIGAQLHKATLDDLLIPSFGKYDEETLFDVDIVHRLIASFIEQQGELEDLEDNISEVFDEVDGFNSPTQNPMVKVGKLLDGYLAEIAADANLALSKFVGLAELIPEFARPVEDGLYRAIDIYLKAHPGLTDVERKKLCRLLDFQKLSQEACTHAAQNERLPVQAVVQVLYFEQLRIRNVMAGSYHPESGMGEDAAIANHNQVQSASSNTAMSKISNGALVCASLASPKDHYAAVRRENRELKLEVARMRMRLSDLEKDHLHLKLDMEKGHHPPNHRHQHGFFHAVTRSISKLNPFHHHKLNPAVHSQQHHYSHSQPEPQRRVSSHSLSSASSFEQSRKEHSSSSKKKRHSLS